MFHFILGTKRPNRFSIEQKLGELFFFDQPGFGHLTSYSPYMVYQLLSKQSNLIIYLSQRQQQQSNFSSQRFKCHFSRLSRWGVPILFLRPEHEQQIEYAIFWVAPLECVVQEGWFIISALYFDQNTVKFSLH